jgi:hypothetical protein
LVTFGEGRERQDVRRAPSGRFGASRHHVSYCSSAVLVVTPFGVMSTLSPAL